MYYIMDCPLLVSEEDGGELVELHKHFKLAGIRRWWSGALISTEKKNKIPNPVEFNFDPLRGYSGSPPEMDDLGIPLMSKRLFDALTKAGVDNIEYFPAVLKNTKTKQIYPYFVYNIVGKISATDLTNSEYTTFGNESTYASTSFNKLVLDETKIHQLLLFRLAEDVSAIVVHEKIKTQIEDSGINTMEFIKPEDYTQI
ncbi:imm11 family protein [Thalassomonas actiniarum]|uniref:Immunity MXAN-0049 protein domain-containing protein n=1 Tax=Thalassomonas actiniarum TaxID=485447 RepID=A0AAE9YQ75_9GAMM|nr:DUF1629 domain-containing protein [Thalassomonas actiniarum]WDD97547.1 hypothetical protein SG35_019815 [Thalassomonas actiniarum]